MDPMNFPYECHNCGTTFDLLDDDDKGAFDNMNSGLPEKVQVVCPGCYNAGFEDRAQREYVVELKTGKLVK